MFNLQLWKDSFRSTKSFWFLILPFIFLINFLILIFNKNIDDSVSTIQLLFFSNIAGLSIVAISIFFVVVPNVLNTRPIDRGYLTYTLSTKLSRLKIILNKMTYFIFCITSYVFINFLIVFIFILIKKPTYINSASWTLQCLGYWLFLSSVGSICFMFSSIFNKSSLTLLFSSILIVLFYTLYITSSVVLKTDAENLKLLKNLKYLTLFSLFDYTKIESKDVSKFIYNFIVLSSISVVCYSISSIVYIKKDLPL
ncbi:hypothetical protein [Mycoplasma yeatsii]|uniref:ABC-2 type transport system permease protein n=1 Tax=Mycoplasma yeatsii TaxID=51365 RepID=A0ABU0NEV4_9MOLU|nr:hypothetical protein [Mycoplasma yeatsii]MDQ0567556.1 ABC-2 type transport system permease protein [Mycoplasma yeatsii]